MGRITEAVKHLIILNVILFIAPKILGGFDLQNLFALHFPKNPDFGIWQFVTHMFMHSQHTFMHILFNMYGLWAFGTPLEQMWGRNKFLFFFIFPQALEQELFIPWSIITNSIWFTTN